ncbi:hypothetical protein K377_01738 [Streptomyces sp. PsTaAH-137]|nr:hypothetical protein [Streptomyces sp. SID8367]MYT74194.1 hypothetical protein [Streptomyces sp. SID8367]RAJ89612.1 hypothetical protein K377_01738 [Streptomyces sp. PsTaAH-137]
MGVFDMFRRKAKDTEATSTAEGGAATLTAEPEAEGVPDAESVPEAAEAASDASEEPRTAEAGAADAEEAAEAGGTAEAGAAAVEIPKQQSAQQAADNEAGEGARK